MRVLLQYERGCVHSTVLISSDSWVKYLEFLENHHIEIPFKKIGLTSDNGFISASIFLQHIKIFIDSYGLCEKFLPRYSIGSFGLLNTLQYLFENHVCSRNCLF